MALGASHGGIAPGHHQINGYGRKWQVQGDGFSVYFCAYVEFCSRIEAGTWLLDYVIGGR